MGTALDLSESSPSAPQWLKVEQGRLVIGSSHQDAFAIGHLLRETEQTLLKLFGRGQLSGTVHTCLGQELCAVGLLRALSSPRDVVLSNHRNHGHFLAYSGQVRGLLAEIMGREGAVCGGRGGSQHLAFHRFHSSGVQAGLTGIGVGLAKAEQCIGEDGVVAIFIGDGTLGEGLLYESMNLASIWKLPVIFVVEHNRVAQTTETKDTIGGTIEKRGEAFGLTTHSLDDSSPSFFDDCERIVSQVRKESTPAFVVVETARLGPHSKGDDHRPEEEKERIAKRDPLRALGEQLERSVREEIEAANTTYLETLANELVLAPEPHESEIHFPDGKQAPLEAIALELVKGSVRDQINHALHTLFSNDDKALLIGEDLHDPYGGAFKVTKGLSTAFPDRTVSTPISEAGITGVGIGFALSGHKPIVEIMFADFLSLCIDQLYNQAVKLPWLGREEEFHLVVRTPGGGHRGYGPTHSQCVESLLMPIPGLTLVAPSHRHNVGQLLCSSVEAYGPVVFMENKLLYDAVCEPGDYETVPPVASDLYADFFPTLLSKTEGSPDLTIVTFGGNLPLAEQVADRLRDEEELSVALVIPSLLSPVPHNTLFSALGGHETLVFLEESPVQGSFSSEVIAGLSERGMHTESILRIGAKPIPVAAARNLERAVLPQVDSVLEEIFEVFG